MTVDPHPSKILASMLGEARGRTTSTVIGQALADLTGLPLDVAREVGHVGMFAAFLSGRLREPLIAALAILFFVGRG